MAVAQWKPVSKCWQLSAGLLPGAHKRKEERKIDMEGQTEKIWQSSLISHSTEKISLIAFKIFYKALEDGSKEKYPQNISQLALSNIAPRVENVCSSGDGHTPAFLPQAVSPLSLLRTCFPVTGGRTCFPHIQDGSKHNHTLWSPGLEKENQWPQGLSTVIRLASFHHD